LIGDGDDGGGGVGDVDIYKESTEPVLVSLSNSYLLLKSILVSVSRPSSYPILQFLLATFTDYYLEEIVNNFGLRRLFYFKQDLKDACCSPTYIMMHVRTNIFFFYLFFLILYLFSFEFLFLFIDK